jgi:hypothetical protein
MKTDISNKDCMHKTYYIYGTNWKRIGYRVSSDFAKILRDLIPEVLPSQKCHTNESSSQQLWRYGQK